MPNTGQAMPRAHGRTKDTALMEFAVNQDIENKVGNYSVKRMASSVCLYFSMDI